MQNWAPLMSAVVAVGFGLGMWTISNVVTLKTHEFLTKEEALNAAKSNHQIFASSALSQFAFFKYNGTIGDADAPQFIITEADPHTKTRSEWITSKVSFDVEHSGQYLSNKLTDRFVWIYREGFPGGSEYFVDAKTGEFIAQWTPCPGCVCHHDNKAK